MTLSADQIAALQNGEVLRLHEAGLECVVVRADVYDRVSSRKVDAQDWSDQELRNSLSRSSEGNGWDEPNMDDYDNYDEKVARRCQ